MRPALQTPVLTSLNEDQLASFFAFINRVRANQIDTTNLEVERLQPYLGALSAQLKKDLAQATAAEQDHLKDLVTPQGLTSLFNAIARHTRNTILTQILLAPESLLKNAQVTEEAKQFSGAYKYDDLSFTLSFIQAFAPEDKKSSVSIPVFAFDDKMMEALAPFKPEALFSAFQPVMTAGNHDMLHHYSNAALNTDISRASLKGVIFSPLEEFSIVKWFDKHFAYSKYPGDENPGSYESWLMLNHARVRRILEEGPEGEALKQACDRYFDELARIGNDMAAARPAEEVHKAVDYFGTMALFALMRFMPLHHPIFAHALERLEKIDPTPSAITEKSLGVIEKIHKNEEQKDYKQKALVNYAAAGVPLMPPEGVSADYATTKRLQLLLTVPWITHIMGPQPPGTPIVEVAARVASVGLEMITRAVLSANADAPEGKQTIPFADGTAVEIWRKDKLPHREGAPAISFTKPDGMHLESWYENGAYTGRIQTTPQGSYTEEWFKGPNRHKEGAPAYIRKDPANDTYTERWKIEGKNHRIGGPAFIELDGHYYLERWYVEGQYHRDDGPAYTMLYASGAYAESWHRNGKKHRKGGPAEIEISSSGDITERWYIDGELHREDGPAYTGAEPDGSYTERWSQNGKMHRIGGPAYSSIAPRGSYEEKWAVNGEFHREDGPAHIEISHNGSRIEKWYKNDQLHRDDGPAEIHIEADGTRRELWYKNGLRHRDDGPAVTISGKDALSRSWYIDGQQHRVGGPAFVREFADGSYEEGWWENGKLHRVGGPASSKISADGAYEENWIMVGKRHRDDGPAIIQVDADGDYKEAWYRHDREHRIGGPSFGQILNNGYYKEQWKADGQYHREINPAYTEIGSNGNMLQAWCLNDVILRKVFNEGQTITEQFFENQKMVREIKTAPPPPSHQQSASPACG